MSTESSNAERWWESYLVRYFLGFIFGVICVLILISKIHPDIATSLLGKAAPIFLQAEKMAPPSPLPDDRDGPVPAAKKTASPDAVAPSAMGESGSTSFAIAIALLGLAYCYIASTPVTVLHGTRMINTWVSANSRAFWMGWGLSLLCYAFIKSHHALDNVPRTHIYDSSALLLLIAAALWTSNMAENTATTTATSQLLRITDRQLVFSIFAFFFFILAVAGFMRQAFPESSIGLLIFSMPVLWITISQYWALFALLQTKNDKRFVEFYMRISKARQRAGAKDIRDSYSHLREHSNSIFVVVIELCILSALLYFLDIYHLDTPSTLVLTASAIKSEEFNVLVLFFLGLWLIPTIYMWGLANRLERKFAENPSQFVP
jgi:hypothetical protein